MKYIKRIKIKYGGDLPTYIKGNTFCQCYECKMIWLDTSIIYSHILCPNGCGSILKRGLTSEKTLKLLVDEEDKQILMGISSQVPIVSN